jgi:tRNA threonylcarbamoyladenosine biosynthesis protein TsaB
VKILAIDTATQLCGVAVLDSETGRFVRKRQVVTTHSEMLLSLVADCLDELKLQPADLGGVALGAGPGSFTGLRIGCATAKGLCYALSIPLTMVSSLQALALPHCEHGSVLATLDAFRGQVYGRLEPSLQASVRLRTLIGKQPQLLRDAAWNPDELAALLEPVASELVLCGSGVVRYPQLRLGSALQIDEEAGPCPLVVARLGLVDLVEGKLAHLASALPTYVTVSAAEEDHPGSASESDPGSVAWTR